MPITIANNWSYWCRLNAFCLTQRPALPVILDWMQASALLNPLLPTSCALPLLYLPDASQLTVGRMPGKDRLEGGLPIDITATYHAGHRFEHFTKFWSLAASLLVPFPTLCLCYNCCHPPITATCLVAHFWAATHHCPGLATGLQLDHSGCLRLTCSPRPVLRTLNTLVCLSFVSLLVSGCCQSFLYCCWQTISPNKRFNYIIVHEAVNGFLTWQKMPVMLRTLEARHPDGRSCVSPSEPDTNWRLRRFSTSQLVLFWFVIW